jgi:crossover junction endodeoxyribonuclease RusA
MDRTETGAVVADAMLTVIIPIKTVSAANVREHYMVRARRVKSERMAAYVCMRMAGPAPSGKATITLTRITGPRGKTLDDDNLATSQKAIRDGIADWLGVQDDHPRLTWRYGQEKGSEWAVRVEVEQ